MPERRKESMHIGQVVEERLVRVVRAKDRGLGGREREDNGDGTDDIVPVTSGR